MNTYEVWSDVDDGDVRHIQASSHLESVRLFITETADEYDEGEHMEYVTTSLDEDVRKYSVNIEVVRKTNVIVERVSDD